MSLNFYGILINIYIPTISNHITSRFRGKEVKERSIYGENVKTLEQQQQKPKTQSSLSLSLHLYIYLYMYVCMYLYTHTYGKIWKLKYQVQVYLSSLFF